MKYLSIIAALVISFAAVANDDADSDDSKVSLLNNACETCRANVMLKVLEIQSTAEMWPAGRLEEYYCVWIHATCVVECRDECE